VGVEGRRNEMERQILPYQIIPVIASNAINILQLENVIYAPNVDRNLLSLTTLYDRGYEISMHPQHGINVLM
jgi:hypothetical protein